MRGSAGSHAATTASTQRVAVVAPVAPWRGGIAEHTTLLCRALPDETETLVISFRRQFPEWLYPGGEQRTAVAPLAGARFIIDSLNPLTWLQACRMLADFRPALVLIPWWTAYLGPCLGVIAAFCRRRGMHVRFFCHNVADHEPARWKDAVTRLVWRQGRSLIVQTAADEAWLHATVPTAVVLRHPQPSFEHFPEARSVRPRRARLELLFFGFIRPYKGLDVLLDAMSQLRDESVYLTIAGEPWSSADELARRLDEHGLRDRVELIPRYLSEVEAAEVFARADAVVLPYRSGGSSAVLAVAYRYGKPVIVTRVGGLAEAVIEGETGFVVPPDSAAALARVIAHELTAERAAAMEPAIARRRRAATWESLARCATSLQ